MKHKRAAVRFFCSGSERAACYWNSGAVNSNNRDDNLGVKTDGRMKMEKLIRLLGDAHARTVEMLAAELDTSVEDVKRKIEYLEHTGLIKKIFFPEKSCTGCRGTEEGLTASCGGCPSKGKNTDGSAAVCRGCMPDGGFRNMGEMWEVIKT